MRYKLFHETFVDVLRFSRTRVVDEKRLEVEDVVGIIPLVDASIDGRRICRKGGAEGG